MAMNWFEGARRITLLLQATIVLLSIAYVVFDDSSPGLTLETSSPTDPFHISQRDCDATDASEFLNHVRIGLASADVTLCFRGVPVEGQYEIPYKAAGQSGSWLLGEFYSPEVTAYTEERAHSFKFPDELILSESKELSRYQWIEKRSRIQGAFWFCLISLGMLWMLATVVGWIVRGFVGIPRGRDTRET